VHFLHGNSAISTARSLNRFHSGNGAENGLQPDFGNGQRR
jgi:hypothetical protein